MAYKLTISERADEMIYERVGYLINKLSSDEEQKVISSMIKILRKNNRNT